MNVGETINLVSNYYEYTPSTLISGQSNEFKVLFGKDYWLANEFIDVTGLAGTGYGIRHVYKGGGNKYYVGGSGPTHYLTSAGSNAAGSVRKYGVMPMICLKNGISLEPTEENIDGYTVWNIAQ